MNKILFDSHAHINYEGYSQKDRERLAADIEASPVKYVMDVGFDLESSSLSVENSEKYPWCYAAVGIHPHDVEGMDEEMLLLLKGLTRKPKVKAIGEIGLDFYRDLSPRDTQRRWFRKQIRLAMDLDMPIIIHDREAHGEVLDTLKDEGVFDRKNPSLLMHCYSGSSDMAEQYVKLGATISIAGPVTFKNSRKLVEVVERIPIEHLLVETDAPYLTPEPYRGKSNKSPYVEYTARKVADIKNMDYEEVAKITCDNAKRFFRIEA